MFVLTMPQRHMLKELHLWPESSPVVQHRNKKECKFFDISIRRYYDNKCMTTNIYVVHINVNLYY